MKTVIAIDGLGGTESYNAIVPAMRHAYDELEDDSLVFRLYAPESLIQPLIKQYRLHDHVIMHNVEQSIKDTDHPLKILQKGDQSTMGLAIHAVKDQQAHAVISSGSTSGYVVLCHKILGLIPGIAKIALPGVVPTLKGKSIMLDLGATLSIAADDLIQFALMGSALAKELLEIERPLVGLLNVGTEDVKGLAYLTEAHKILKQSQYINYYGFIEGTDICRGTVDVVVTDGFSGNIALKAMEGVSVLINSHLKEHLLGSLWKKIISCGALWNLHRMKQKLDHRHYNGAALLGLAHLAIKSHGSADKIAFANAIKVTHKLCQKQLIKNLEQSFVAA